MKVGPGCSVLRGYRTSVGTGVRIHKLVICQLGLDLCRRSDSGIDYDSAQNQWSTQSKVSYFTFFGLNFHGSVPIPVLIGLQIVNSYI